jgi:PAS domain S-box-containing protein
MHVVLRGIKRPNPGDGVSLSGFDLGPVPMWVHDDETRHVLAVNDSALRQYGYSREQFLAMTIDDLSSASGEPEAVRAVCRHRQADGTEIEMRLETSAIEVSGRAATLVVAIDVTGETRALAESERRCRDLVASEEVLRRSEGRFRELFETASDWYWENDAQGRLTFVSANFETMFGIPTATLYGKRLNDLANSKVDPESGQLALAAIKARRPYRDLIYSHSLPGGGTIEVKTSAVPMVDGDGHFCGYCGVAKDVTAQTEAERALRESGRQFRDLFETTSDWYWESNAEGQITFVSSNYESIFGVPPAQVLGKRLTESSGVSVEPEMGRMVLTAMKAKRAYRDFVYSRVFGDGKKRWFKVSAAPMQGPDGEFRGYRGAGAEITKSVEAEATARLTRRRLNEAVAYVTQPFVVFDAEGRIIAFNQAFADLHRTPDAVWPVNEGVALQALVEWQVRTGFYAGGSADEATDLETLLAFHHSVGEHTYHLGDGRWMLVTYRGLPGDARVGLWSDVTAIKRAEQDRRGLEEQLHHSQRLEALGTLAGGVAHEINNALVPVLTLTKMVASKLPSASRERRYLETALQGAERTRDLVKRILAFSRKEEQHRESVDVAAVLREALHMMRATTPTNIRLEAAIASAPCIVGDRNQLHQVVINLVNNASHAIGAAMGTIIVGLESDPDGVRLCLSVSDTGRGMDEATRARIFEPFYTTKDVGEGTGLGLSVVHGIVKEHGGSIEVASTPGQGTRFDVMLPLEPAEPPHQVSATPAAGDH